MEAETAAAALGDCQRLLTERDADVAELSRTKDELNTQLLQLPIVTQSAAGAYTCSRWSST
jgi:hypothetical protein